MADSQQRFLKTTEQARAMLCPTTVLQGVMRNYQQTSHSYI